MSVDLQPGQRPRRGLRTRSSRPWARAGDFASSPFPTAFRSLVWRVSEAAPILQMPDKKARGSFATQADWSRELSPSAGCWDPPAGRVEAGVGPQASAKRGEAAPPRHAELDLTAAGGVWGWAMQWGPGRVRPGEGGGRERQELWGWPLASRKRE